jgi:hypothetical protein
MEIFVELGGVEAVSPGDHHGYQEKHFQTAGCQTQN